jgi:hypothetical protein
MANFEVIPNIDGTWSLYRACPVKALGTFATIEEAKKAADNLCRPTVYYKAGEQNDTSK